MPHDIDAMFQNVDLVVAGTDQFSAQAMINEVVVRKKIPAVFIGVHAGAEGGRIVWYVPGTTPCYRCVAKDRYAAADSGNGNALNLAGASGSIFDCQFIDMVAAKIGIAILERGQDSTLGRFFAAMAARNDVIVRCDPEYQWGGALGDALLNDLPNSPKEYARELKERALFAMDTIWLKSEFDHGCPVCASSR